MIGEAGDKYRNKNRNNKRREVILSPVTGKSKKEIADYKLDILVIVVFVGLIERIS